MSATSGIAFLFAGIAAFVLGVVLIALLDRSQHRPGRTVAGFQRATRSLRKIFRAHLAIRDAARLRARASHPARQRQAADGGEPANGTPPGARRPAARNQPGSAEVLKPRGTANRRDRRPA